MSASAAFHFGWRPAYHRRMYRWTAVLVVVTACGGATPAPQTPTSVASSPDAAPAAEATELPEDVCDNRNADGYGEIVLTSAQLGLRRGEQARTFADIAASQERPIEVCGPDGELEWLRRVTCVDGSNPFPTPVDARDARTGNVGPGGRCGSIIDLYEVRCPEATYDIHMDMYWCLEGTGLTS